MNRRSFLRKSTTALSGTLIVAGVTAKALSSHGKERAPGTLEGRVYKLREMKDVACAPGTVDYDPYFQGMANGIIFALAVMDDDDGPAYREAPKEWGRDKRDVRLAAEGWGKEGVGKIDVEPK